MEGSQMAGFDVLDPSLNLKRNIFLEASAGTGKTFTIENLVVRLLQEGIAIEKILIVTFTRAATLELKIRIRKRLEELKLRSVLATFDEAQIFTIHGFCFHMLKEEAFESGFSLSQSDESASPEAQKEILKDFLRTQLLPDEIHPLQLEKALRRGGNKIEGLIKNLMKRYPSEGRSYAEIRSAIERALQKLSWQPSLEELVHYASSFKGFCDRKGKVHPEWIESLKQSLPIFEGHLDHLIDLPLLKMKPDNLKQKAPYPERLHQADEELIPLLEEISDTDLILGRLAKRSSKYLKEVCEKEDLFFYDDLLRLMHQNIHNPAFAAAVRQQYEAVLIDEFQDTDPIQWEIFSTLFLHHLPLFIVGDPKQSIYRFRGADLYAYLTAKKTLGDEAYETLTRNFRSQPSLIGGLNTLFQKVEDLIKLPKTGEAISILPIIPALPHQHEGKIVFAMVSSEESLYLWIIGEIERLHCEEGIPYRECAVLVKDRYQTQRFCALCPLPYATKRSESLLDSDAFPVLEDLLRAVLNPRERSYVIKVLGGPLFHLPLEELSEKIFTEATPIYRYHQLLSAKGILAFFSAFVEEFSFPSSDLYLDLWQLVEMVAENCAGPEEYLPYLEKLNLKDPEADLLKAHVKCEEDAVQVMTLHVSKGLEFEATFPIGLMKEADLEDPEDLSEKMRQLYVAMTRAKRHLYLPVIDKEGSPMHYFLNRVLQGESLETFVKAHASFALIHCPDKTPLPHIDAPTKSPIKQSQQIFTFRPYAIHSYTSLTAHTSYETPLKMPSEAMPAGPEIGILLHRIFEKLDFTQKGDQLRTFLEKELSGTPLNDWIESVYQMVHETLQALLTTSKGSFCLADVDPQRMIREMEFLYSSEEPHGYIKGYIDLFFEHQGAYYCLDWKSNFLPDYSAQSLMGAIESHRYDIQAQLYHQAAQKYLKLFGAESSLSGSFYLFLRGLKGGTDRGIHFFAQEEL